MVLARPRRNVSLALALTAALSLPSLLPAQHPNPEPQVDPAILPAHDAHQGLLVAVRPDASAESSKAKFGPRSPYASGVLGLDVYFRNDTDQPIRVTLNTVQLLIGAPGEKPQQLDQLSYDQVADLILAKSMKDPTRTHRSPIPLPPSVRPAHDKNWLQLDNVLRSATMPSGTVQPHSTTHGYFYFDIDHKFDWLSNARLDVPDLVFPDSNQALFFFDIDLAAAAATP